MKRPHLTQITLLIAISFLILTNCIEESSDPIPGEAGTNGYNAMVNVETEASGTNCEFGGVKISVGQDSNDNGTLDESEVESISYVCNGGQGTDGNATGNLLAKTSPELPGEHCTNGGTLVEIGMDANENNTLDSNEIQSAFYVCNGSEGSSGNNGAKSLIKATVEDPGVNCDNGGLKLEIGLDENNNGVLDTGEIESSYYICDGENGGTNGYNTLIQVQTEPAGKNCINGGLSIVLGLDTNRSGTLDEGESVGLPQYICNGLNGSNGTNGKSPVVKSNTDISSCSNGGVELTFGYDNDSNGTIDDVLETITICNGNDGSDGKDGSNGKDGTNGTNGTNGFNTIIVTTTDPTACPNGGVEFKIGLDANRNNLIDEPGELQATRQVCNGTNGSNGTNGMNGNNSLIKVSAFSGSLGTCTSGYGGYKIDYGVDDNGDGILNTGEIDASSYLCNGANGSNGNDGSDGASDGVYEFYFSEGLNGYTGTSDCSIDQSNSTTVYDGETLKVKMSNPEVVRQINSVIQFPEVEKIKQTVTNEFVIIEAILYIRAYTDTKDTNVKNNWIGAKILQPADVNFIESEATWDTKTSKDSWKSGSFSDTDCYEYSDMYQLPSGFDFNGVIPLLLDRTQVTEWMNADNNEGIALEMVDNTIAISTQYTLNIYSSENKTDPNYAPILYIKVKEGSLKARSYTLSDQEYKAQWNALSYEEKLAKMPQR